MDFTHSEERRMLGETVRRFLADNYPIETRHTAAGTETGFTRETWRAFAELGLIAALFREEDGGFGGTGHDIAVLFEELGRSLVVEPFLPTLLAGTALALAGNEQQKRLLSAAIAGEAVLTLAHGEPDSRYELSRVTASAQRTDKGWVLNGRKAVVLNGDAADRIVVTARTGGEADEEAGISLFLIDGKMEGLTVRGYPTIDGLHAAEVSFNDLLIDAGCLVGKEGAGYATVERATGMGVLALAAEALGAMETAKDMTLDYLQTRKQFGKPIGAFQAIQHRMVDMLTEVEQVRSTIINAASRMTASDAEREWSLSAAKHLAGKTGRLVAEETIQLHGAIGMTWEYALGHYAKRLVMIDHMLGDADHHLQRAMHYARPAA